MVEINGKEIVRGAKEWVKADGPYSKLGSAKAKLEDAELGHLDFGIIGGFAFNDGYNDARDNHIKNLTEGVDKFKAMIEGLNTVARNHDAVEQANSVLPTTDDGDTDQAPVDDSRDETAATIGIFFVLALENLAIATMLGVAGTMAPLALVGLVAWATFVPNDDALNDATSKWEDAKAALENYPDLLTAGQNVIDAAWEGDDKTTFDTFLSNFNIEVKDTKDQLEACKTTLEEVAEKLDEIQQGLLIVVLVALAAIIVAQALVAVPIIGAAFEAIKQALGGILGATTSSIVVLIIFVLVQHKDFFLTTAQKTFDGEKPESDDVSFDDVALNIDWDSV